MCYIINVLNIAQRHGRPIRKGAFLSFIIDKAENINPDDTFIVMVLGQNE